MFKASFWHTMNTRWLETQSSWPSTAEMSKFQSSRATTKRISAYARFLPMQSRGPAEKGLKAALLSVAYRGSYRAWVTGSQRSGANFSGLAKFLGLWYVAH